MAVDHQRMNNPWRQFKMQPWRSLMLVAGITIVFASLLENILLLVLQQSASLQQGIFRLFQTPFGTLIPLAVTMGIGGLGVWLCERWQRQVYLNTSSLWALILCLLVGLWLKSVLPGPTLFLALSRSALIGVVVGVFWQGRRYWRY